MSVRKTRRSVPKSTQVLLDRVERQLASGRPYVYAGTQAELAVKRLVTRNPTPLWRLITRWGDHPSEAAQDAVGDWLTDVLRNWYDRFIRRAETLAIRKPRFGTVLLDNIESVAGYNRRAEIRELKRRLRAAGVRKPIRRKVSLDEILEAGNFLFSHDLFERIMARRRRTAGEIAAYRVHLVGLEVPEGGFGQFFYNTPIRDIVGTPAALRRIGAMRCAKDLERAIALCSKRGLPRHRVARMARAEELSGARRRALGILWRRFPSENLDALLRTYVSEHREEFPD